MLISGDRSGVRFSKGMLPNSNHRASINSSNGDIGNYSQDLPWGGHFLDFPRFCKTRHDEK
jgi:hypothetical protein